MSKPLAILGASVRAAAFSARAAGFAPACADMFADSDLRQIALTELVQDYPQGLIDALENFPVSPWMYTGALENHPHLVDRISQQRPLLGNRGEVLRQARDPFVLEADLAKCGLELPSSRRADQSIPTDGTWLRKPYRGSGGHQIVPWTGERAAQEIAGGNFYFQERKAGAPHAAVFVAASGQATLLGVTRQIVGTRWAMATQFQYAGSIGPVSLTPEHLRRLQQAGHRLANVLGLVGLFGVDFLVDGEKMWFLEINPRYPASAEVLEQSLGFSVVGKHVAACRNGSIEPAPALSTSISGKAIVYAQHDLVVPDSLVRRGIRRTADKTKYELADIPSPGTEIPAGAPIATVLAHAHSEEEVENRLRLLATSLRSKLCTAVP